MATSRELRKLTYQLKYEGAYLLPSAGEIQFIGGGPVIPMRKWQKMMYLKSYIGKKFPGLLADIGFMMVGDEERTGIKIEFPADGDVYYFEV